MAAGKDEVLVSGFTTSDTYAYTARKNVIGYGRASIFIDYLGPGSGVGYIVRGYPVRGLSKSRILTSGQILSSGNGAFLTVTDAYGEVDVGLINIQTNMSCSVTVMAIGKRR